MTIHPVGYSGMPMHMYPFPPGLVPAQPLRSKRRQVKNACTNCQKACKKCDDARPCLRCVKYGIAEECVDSQRKERKKGIKRGPYKKRDGKGNNVEQLDVPIQQGIPLPQGVPPPSASPPMAPYMNPVGYPPGFYPQFQAPPTPKPGDGTPFYPQFYIAPMQMASHPGQEGHDNQGYPHPQFYPATFLPYAQPYPPYMMSHRPDGQMSVPPPHYATYPPPMYAKPPSAGGSSDSGNGYRADGRHGEHGEDK
ncbi:hypothetical protein SERLADRAFT_357497 [Serpula lacrymans var. lacrymans S7.9]|uniref:Transcription activator of gluconeogenesis ERT1 n=1 Tax=Serpula lacrymans var. lacrymans (strain S7.9) TaxID=578457 RepID=F8P4W9_SERL9|nr:uncharacterized protein SERLADRAFT_357497 [Serpula lacrymans var. lacrymans S7.9]EGO21656.1 hypothetical protein SERLADRAFT_357497 [Serpula lacrymans var. lacrymans S7.9]